MKVADLASSPDGNPVGPWVGQRATRIAIAVTVVLVATASFSRYGFYLSERVGAQDDYIWLYMTGAKVGDRARGDQLLQEYNAVDDNLVHRLRSDYEQNYFGISVVYRVAAELTEINYRHRLVSRYPAYVSSAMVAGFDIGFALTILFLCAVMITTRELVIVGPIAVGIAGMSFLETLFPPVNQYLVDHETWSEITRHLAAFVINPSFNFSIFGFTPRSTFALAVVGVAGLRMRGWFCASYLAILLMSFVHQSYAGLLLFSALASDAVSRPSMVARASIWPLAALTFAWFGFGQRIWQHSFGMSVVAAIAGLLAGVGALVAAQLSWQRARGGTVRDRNSIVRMVPAKVLFADTGVVLALWCLVLPVAASMKGRLAPEQWLYFWSQINGRWLGIIRPLLFMTTAFVILELARRVTERRQGQAAIIIALTTALSVPSLLAWMRSDSHGDVVNRLHAEFVNLDRAIQIQSAATFDDAAIYYAVSKALDTGKELPVLPIDGR